MKGKQWEGDRYIGRNFSWHATGSTISWGSQTQKRYPFSNPLERLGRKVIVGLGLMPMQLLAASLGEGKHNIRIRQKLSLFLNINEANDLNCIISYYINFAWRNVGKILTLIARYDSCLILYVVPLNKILYNFNCPSPPVHLGIEWP